MNININEKYIKHYRFIEMFRFQVYQSGIVTLIVL